MRDKYSTLKVSWTPANNGFSVTGYVVTVFPGGKCAVVPSTQTTAYVGALEQGATYQARVAVRTTGTLSSCNTPQAGDGVMSGPSAPVTLPVRAPAATVIVERVPEDGQVRVTWPRVAGATSYTVMANPGGIQRSVPARTVSAVLGGLQNGMQYSVTVTANNAVGSTPSAAVTVTPGTGVPSELGAVMPGTVRAGGQSISDDGTYVAWSEGGTGEMTERWLLSVFLANTQAQTTAQVSQAFFSADAPGPTSMSGDGRYLVFDTPLPLVVADTNYKRDVYLYDAQLDVFRLVSAVGNGNSANASISADGSTVAFLSAASNFVPGDVNGTTDAFVVSLMSGQITRVAEMATQRLYLSGDGSVVVGTAGSAFSVRWSDPGTYAVFDVAPSLQRGSAACGISRDGTRVYFNDAWTNTKINRQRVDAFVGGFGGGGGFMISRESMWSSKDAGCQSVSADGSVVLYGRDSMTFVSDHGIAGVLVPGVMNYGYGYVGPAGAVIAADNRSVAMAYISYNPNRYMGVFRYSGLGGTRGQVWTAAWRQSVNTLTGAYTRIETDASMGGMGPSMAVTRRYSSDDLAGGGFGPGWSSSFEYGLSRLGEAVTVHYPDGRQEMFAGSGNPRSYTPPAGSGARLALSGSGWVVSQVDGSSGVFDSSGRATRIVDAQGHGLVLGYSSGRLTTVTNESSGRAWTFAWTNGRISSVTGGSLPGGVPLTWAYGYTNGVLTQVCSPSSAGQPGGCRTYTYDTPAGGAVLLTRVDDERDRTVAVVGYYSTWRVQSVAENGHGASTYAYGLNGGDPALGAWAEVTNARNATSRDEYDPSGRIAAQVDALGHRVTMTYGSNAWPESITDANGIRSEFTYTTRGQKLTERTGILAGSSAGRVQWYTYDTGGNLAGIRDARSSSATDTRYLTQRVFDANHNVISETGPPVPGFDSGTQRTWTYTTGSEAAVGGGTMPTGLVLTATDQVGRVTTYAYTSGGDLAEMTSPTGVVTRLGYNELGWVTSQTVISDAYPDGVTTTSSYTARGQLLTVTGPATTDAVTGQPHQLATTTTYDAAGYRVWQQSVDVASSAQSRLTQWVVDAGGRVTSTTVQVGSAPVRQEQTLTSYDAVGNLLSVTDPAGRITTYGYTARNEVSSITRHDATAAGTTADVVIAAYTYDAGGRVYSSSDAAGRTTCFDYTPDGKRYRTRLFGFVDPDGTSRDVVVEQLAFDAVGNVTSQSTGNGGITQTFAYDALNRMTTSTFDPSSGPASTAINRISTLTYDAAGRIATHRVGDQTVFRETRYDYDVSGQPSQVTIENGTADLVTWMGYDDRGLPVTVTDGRGGSAGDPAYTTSTSYDQLGRPVTVTGPPVVVDGQPATTQAVTTTGYDAYGQAVHVEDPTGAIVTTSYDQLGRRIQATLPDYTRPDTGQTVQAATTWTYDTMGRLTATTSPAGTTAYGYDDLDHLVSRTDPATPAGTAVWGWSVDRVGRVTQAVDPTGATVTQAYDMLDRVVSTTQIVRATPGATPGQYTTTTTYDDRGFPTSSTTPTGATTTYTVNDDGNVTATITPLSHTWTTGFDVLGQQTSSRTPAGAGSTTVYDLAGRVTRVDEVASTGQVLASTAQDYDAVGNPVTVTSPNGWQTLTRYDAANQVTSITDPITADTWRTQSFGYDVAGRLVRTTDGRGHDTTQSGGRLAGHGYDVTYSYTPWGLPESIVEPATSAHPSLAERTWTTSYDASGNPVTESQPGGVTVHRVFDASGSLLSETGSGAGVVSATRSLTYDLVGRLTGIDHPGGVQAFGWDDRGLMVSASGPGGSTSLGYDGDGRVVSAADPSGWYAFAYRGDGLVSAMTMNPTGPASVGGAGTTIQYGYDTTGRQTTQTYQTNGVATGTSRAVVWDDRDRPVSDTVSGPGGVLASTAYGWDGDANLVSQATSGAQAAASGGAGTTTYAYDRAGRLVSTTAPGQAVVTTGWDGADNRVTHGGQAYIFDARNRLLTGPRGVYTWTPRGTMSTTRAPDGSPVPVSVDALGRVAGVGGVSYAYDGLDRVATITGGGDATQVSYAGMGVDPSRSTTSGTDTRWLRGPGGGLVAVTDLAGSRLVTTNQHSDVTTGFTAAGQVTGQVTYTPFGTVAATGGDVGGGVGFQSDLTDPTTGWVFMGARWYDPDTGAFTVRDTMARHASQARLLNRYSYGAANPLAGPDLDGHCPASGWGGCTMDAGPTSSVTTGIVGPTLDMISLGGGLDPDFDPSQIHLANDSSGGGGAAQSEADFYRDMGLSPSGHLSTVNGFQPLMDAAKIAKANVGKSWGQVKAAASKLTTAQGRAEVKTWLTSGQAGADVKSWVKQNKDYVIGAGLVVVGAVVAFVPGMTAVGVGMVNAGIDVIAQKALTGEVNWAQAAIAGVTGAAFGGLAKLGSIGRLGARDTRMLAGAGIGAAGGGATYLAGTDNPTVGGFASAVGVGVVGGAIGGRLINAQCFVAGTQVLLADGTHKPIEDITVGDQVTAYNPDTGATESRRVVRTFEHDNVPTYDVTLTDRDGATSTVTTTQEHPFWVDGRGWTPAEDLRAGDQLSDPDGATVTVASVHATGRTETVYNFEVDGLHNYHVQTGTHDILVHNTCVDPANYRNLSAFFQGSRQARTELATAANTGSTVPAVVFSRSRAPGIASTFDTAVANGAPTRLNRVTGAARDANRRAALRGQPPAPAGQSLDEYPFACSAQGGCGSFVNPVPVAEQSYQGGVLSSFFQRYGIRPGDPFDVMFGP